MIEKLKMCSSKNLYLDIDFEVDVSSLACDFILYLDFFEVVNKKKIENESKKRSQSEVKKEIGRN